MLFLRLKKYLYGLINHTYILHNLLYCWHKLAMPNVRKMSCVSTGGAIYVIPIHQVACPIERDVGIFFVWRMCSADLFLKALEI